MSRLTPLIAVALAAAVAGCGGDDDPDATVATQTETQTVTQTAPTESTTTDTETDPTTTTPETREQPTDPQGGCTTADGNAIEIVTGDVTCAQAKNAASLYDAQGPRVQEIGDWVCEGGNAQTRPVIFTCTGAGGEFVVREAG